MKVLHVITRMIVGGAQENTWSTCRGLIGLGDDVLLATGPEEGPEGNLLRSSGDGAVVPLRIVPDLCRAVSTRRDWAAFGQLRSLIREFRPDVVHTHSAKAGILGRLAASLEGTPAVIHTVHGAPWHARQPAWARWGSIWAEQLAGKSCDRWISVADAMTRQMTREGRFDPAKFVTIRSGMATAPFLAAGRDEAARRGTRARFGWDDDAVVIGKVARLFPLKGHPYLFAAAERLAKRFPQVRFLLIGDGILREEFEADLRRRGLFDRFRFAGLVPPAEMPGLLAGLDVLVHVSLREGLARALPQALLCGVPVVGFDLDGSREVILPGETGFLTAAEDPAVLAEALGRLIVDPDLRRRLGEKGRTFCTEAFAEDRMVREIRRTYEDVLGTDPAHPRQDVPAAPPAGPGPIG